MDNIEKLVTQGTQHTSQGQQTLENTERAIRNGQSLETGNIGYTGHKSRTTNIRKYTRSNQKWTILRNWQHREHRTQVKDNKHQKIQKEQSEIDNPEKLATQGTQDTRQGQQTLENTQRAITNGQS